MLSKFEVVTCPEQLSFIPILCQKLEGLLNNKWKVILLAEIAFNKVSEKILINHKKYETHTNKVSAKIPRNPANNPSKS